MIRLAMLLVLVARSLSADGSAPCTLDAATVLEIQSGLVCPGAEPACPACDCPACPTVTCPPVPEMTCKKCHTCHGMTKCRECEVPQ